MSDPSLAVQDSVENALRNDPGVVGQFGGKTRLYISAALPDAPFPHIIIGDDQIVGDDMVCASASEVTVNVHVYAREGTPDDARRKAKAIAGAVRGALTKELALAGHVMDDWKFEGTRHPTDPDPLTAHSVVTVTYLTTARD